MDEPILAIVAAAVRLPDGLVCSLPRPARHFNVIRSLASHGIDQQGNHEQGFLLSDGRFCRRTPARMVAEKAGQILPTAGQTKELFSEDVW